jgi:hypothetical protein
MSRLHTEHGRGDNHHRHFASVQHHYNAAYELYDRGYLDDHDLPRLRPQYCRCHNHHHGGADINIIDYTKLNDDRYDHINPGSNEYVHVRRDDYDNLARHVNDYVNTTDDDLYLAALDIVNHHDDDRRDFNDLPPGFDDYKLDNPA